MTVCDMDEMVQVRYQIDTPSYSGAETCYSAFDSPKERKAFYQEADGILLGLGWSVSGMTNASLDGSSLYIHPQEISGTVRDWEVDYIANSLKRAKLFSVRSVSQAVA